MNMGSPTFTWTFKLLMKAARLFHLLLFHIFLGCYEVSFTNAFYYPEVTNGLYYWTGAKCRGRDVYKHRTSTDVYMFHLDEYWYIANETYICSYAYDNCYFRVYDSALYADHITAQWYEYNGLNDYNNFPTNDDIAVDCYGKCISESI